MKTLNKLQINTEKIIKDDELVNLRGGDGQCPPGSVECSCDGTFLGCYSQQERCDYVCKELGY